jgi:hypothetical protein
MARSPDSASRGPAGVNVRPPCYHHLPSGARSVRLVWSNASCSSGERLQQDSRVVASAVNRAVDEQGGSAQYLPRRQAVFYIPVYTLRNTSARAVAVELRDVEAEPGGIPAQCVVIERHLTVEEQLVHIPVDVGIRTGTGLLTLVPSRYGGSMLRDGWIADRNPAGSPGYAATVAGLEPSLTAG